MEQKEMVQYDNSLNKIAFTDFTATDYNFLMALCSRLKDKGTKEISMTYKQIKEITKYPAKTDNVRFVDDLSGMNRKLLKITLGYENEERLEVFVLFTRFVIDKVKKTLTVSVNERYIYLLNELTSQFTKFELETFNELSSKYSKTLFRLLMQYRKTGFVRISKDDLTRILCIPKSYNTNDTIRKILEPSINEIGPYIEDLNMEIIRESTRGKPVKEFIFTFKKSNKQQMERILEPKAEEESIFKICI